MTHVTGDKELNFNKIIETSQEGILIVDLDGAIRFANPAAHRLLNRKNLDLIGKSFGRPLDDGRAVEMGIVRRNDSAGVGEMRFGETVWEGKKAFFVLLLDVTELKHAQEDLQKINVELEKRVEERTAQLQISNERLGAANEELERFAYIASHDLQEPLRKIMNYTEMLASPELSMNREQYLQRVMQAAARMKALIEALLDLAGIDRKREFKQVNLRKIVSGVLDELEAREQAEISIDGLLFIHGDEILLHQLFQNLIGNSIKYRNKTGDCKIMISCKSAGNRHEISVRDNGIGFDMKYADKIFKPLQRLHSSAEYPGTGIGLAACEKIVRHHKGTITADSEAGKGSTFRVTLPIGKPSTP